MPNETDTLATKPLAAWTMDELAVMYLQQDQHVKELEDEVKVAKATLTEIETALVDSMVDKEYQSINKNGNVLYLRVQTNVTTPAENKDALITALKKQGYSDLIKPNISAQTLTALVKELAVDPDEVELPEWLNGICTLYKTTRIGKQKGAGMKAKK